MPDTLPVPAGENPYTAQDSVSPPGTAVDQSDDDRAIRQKYLDVESTAKTIGLIYLIGCGFSMATTLTLVLVPERNFAAWAGLRDAPAASIAAFRTSAAVIAAAGVAVWLVVGLGLRALINGVRILAMILIVLGFVGALFSFLMVFLNRATQSIVPGMLSLALASLFLAFATFLGKPPARFVFSPEYRAIVARTPAFRPSFGARDRVFLGIYAALMALSTGLELAKMFRGS